MNTPEAPVREEAAGGKRGFMGHRLRALWLALFPLALGVLGALFLLYPRQGRGEGPAPDFTLPLFDGGEWRLSAYRGQVVVVNFWGSWCTPCQIEMPALQEVWETYRDRGVVVVGVNVLDSRDDALAFLRETGVTFPTGPDRDGSISAAYRVVGLPTTVFIDRQGRIAHRWLGPISRERLTALVEDLLP
jgi:peroxiredoxin